MARHKNKTQSTDSKPEEEVQVLDHNPVEPEPEVGMTEAAANAITETHIKPPSEGVAIQKEKEASGEELPQVTRHRVLADRPVNIKGQRALMRAGKVVASTEYNINHLRNSGVQLSDELKPGEY